MRSNYHLFVAIIEAVSLLLISCARRDSPAEDISVPLLVQQQEESVKANLTMRYSHIDRWDYVDSVTNALNQQAICERDTIGALLSEVFSNTTRLSKVYNDERDAYSMWRGFQQAVSNDVILAIWELFVGGTAGGDVISRHCYDIASINLADQIVLSVALGNKPCCSSDCNTVTSDQIDHVKETLFGYLGSSSAAIEKAKDVINVDYWLFSEWMNKRKELESCLPDPCKRVYSSNTDYWMLFYYEQIHNCFINQPIE